MERFLITLKQPQGATIKDIENYIKIALKSLIRSVEFNDPLIKLELDSITVEHIGD
jgi:hypothetical protein